MINMGLGLSGNGWAEIMCAVLSSKKQACFSYLTLILLPRKTSLSAVDIVTTCISGAVDEVSRPAVTWLQRLWRSHCHAAIRCQRTLTDMAAMTTLWCWRINLIFSYNNVSFQTVASICNCTQHRIYSTAKLSDVYQPPILSVFNMLATKDAYRHHSFWTLDTRRMTKHPSHNRVDRQLCFIMPISAHCISYCSNVAGCQCVNQPILHSHC